MFGMHHKGEGTLRTASGKWSHPSPLSETADKDGPWLTAEFVQAAIERSWGLCNYENSDEKLIWLHIGFAFASFWQNLKEVEVLKNVIG